MTDSLRDSIIRTYVPYIVGAVGGYASDWLGWTDEETTLAVTLLIGSLYYLLARVLERAWPGASVLLLSRARPMYVRPGRHEAGRRDDAGAVSIRSLTAAVAVLCLPLTVLLTTGGDASADDDLTRALPVDAVGLPFPGVLEAERCRGVLTVRHAEYTPYTRRMVPDPGRVTPDADGLFTGSTDAVWAWTLLQPSGPVAVELRHPDGATRTGTWTRVPAGAVIRQVEREVSVRLNGEAVDLVRVVASYPGLGRVASPGVPVTSCVGGAS